MFTLSLISRLKKEGCQIFSVTGNSRKLNPKPSEVFQEYNFKYDSDSISYILKSIEPEIIIFTGALDSTYDWQNDSNPESEYISGLNNILFHCKDTTVKKFIYISTCSIYSDNKETVILSNTKPNSNNNRDKTYIMAEKLCTSYYDEFNYTINIVRVSEVYGVYKNQVIEGNVCTSICYAASKGIDIQIDKNSYHNLIYIDDVVDYIYRIIRTNNKDKIYNAIGKDGYYNEQQLVSIFEDILNIKVNTIGKISSDKQFSKYLFDETELQCSQKYNIESGLRNVFKVIEKKVANEDKKAKPNKKYINKSQDSHTTRSKLLALVENVVFFLLIQSFIIFTRNMSFHNIIDVYLIYVILVAVLYGYFYSTMAVVFSIIGRLYITVLYSSEYLSSSDYNIYLWILQIFSIGVLVGYIKDNYRRKHLDNKDEINYLRLELESLKDINDTNIRVKKEYEKRLINYKDSFARIYNIVSQLDAIEPEKVIFKSINVMCEIMNTNDVSLYICDPSSEFCRLMAASSDKAKRMKKSIRISSHKEIFDKLKNKEIYINKSMNPNYPLMAGGTYKAGYLQTIILIWSLPFENNNLYEINAFGVLCTLVERTMNRAYEYMEKINESYNMKYDRILTSEAFEKILELYKYGKKDNIVDYSLLKVNDFRGGSKGILINILKGQIRDTDYIGINKNEEEYILLTNSNEEEANYVIERLKNKGITAEIRDNYE